MSRIVVATTSVGIALAVSALGLAGLAHRSAGDSIPATSGEQTGTPPADTAAPYGTSSSSSSPAAPGTGEPATSGTNKGATALVQWSPRVPAPPSLQPSPVPGSAECTADPKTPYCTPDSVRYLTSTDATTAYAQWLPVLKNWGLEISSNTCSAATTAAGLPCVVKGTHAGKTVTVLFKAYYTGQYAPEAVKEQTDTIHTKALNEAAKAGSTAQAAKIMADAKTRITSIEATAKAWNAAHPSTAVNVVIQG
jgi:hypothetical protein